MDEKSKVPTWKIFPGLIGHAMPTANEPSHHVAYLYNYFGAPWKTQTRLQQIVDSQYQAKADGLSGNDDLGQMSAWLVFTSLGFTQLLRK